MFFKTFTKTVRNMKNPSIKKRFRYKFTIKCVIYSTVDSQKCWSISQKVRSSKNLWTWKESKTREELQSLLSLVFVNMDDGKINNRKKKL